MRHLILTALVIAAYTAGYAQGELREGSKPSDPNAKPARNLFVVLSLIGYIVLMVLL